MKAICTICSKEKVHSEGKMPARQRYNAPHIRKTEEVAAAQRVRFFILSGLFGLLEADEPIPHYDYPLNVKDVPRLAKRVASQFDQHYITELALYTEGPKESWKHYEKVLELAAAEARVKLIKEVLA